MKRIISPIVPVLLIAALVFAGIIGCGGSASKIIGQWVEYSEYQYGNQRTEFFKDGTCFIESNGRRLSGRWIALDDGRIKIELMKAGSKGGAPLLTILAVIDGDGDDLVLDVGGGTKNKFVRDGSERAKEIQAQVKKAAAEREKKLAAERRAREEIRKAKLAWLKQQREAERAEREKRYAAMRAEREKRRAAEKAEREKQRAARRAFKAAEVAYKNGLYEKAIAELNKSIDLGGIEAINSLAWLLATCKDKNFQDGKRAVELALKATKIKSCRNYFDTLAAAYARNGQYQKAIDAQIQALSYGSSSSGKKRLKLYRQGKAYQDK
jgi:hypothetical protein